MKKDEIEEINSREMKGNGQARWQDAASKGKEKQRGNEGEDEEREGQKRLIIEKVTTWCEGKEWKEKGKEK